MFQYKASNKRSLLTILVVILLTAALAACSGGNGKGNGTNDNGKSSPGKSNASNNSTSPKEEDTPRGDISVSIYDRGSIPTEEGMADNNRWTKWLNENGPANIKFVAVPRWESREKLNVLFASGNAPDIIFEYDTGYRNELINQKQLMPLNDLIEEHSVEYKALLEKYPILRKVTTSEDGNIYEFARLNGPGLNHLFFIRMDWLEKVNKEVPTTTEELFDVLTAFVKEDPDGNGIDDTFGINVSANGDTMINQMFQSVSYKIENGTMIKPWENSLAKHKYVKRLYDNGLIDKDFLTDKNGEKAKQDFINGKLGIFSSNGAEGYATFKALKTNNPQAKVAAIKLPASEFGQFGPYVNNPVQSVAAIKVNAKDPVAAMKYIDFLSKEETMMTLQFGIEGEHYELDADGVPVTIDQDVFATEVQWNVDFRMMSSPAILGDITHFRHQLDMNDPLDVEYLEIYTQAEQIYLDPAAPMADFTHVEHHPAAPKEIGLIGSNTSEQMRSFYQQAVIGGSKYSVEQAEADAKAYWEKAGGKQVDDWYAQWYAANKDDAIFTKDIYEIKIDN